MIAASNDLRERIAEAMGEAIETRHDLHAHPELGYQESRTSQVVMDLLNSWGIDNRGGLAGGTGVLARIPATRAGAPTLALRADMDALPIFEETGVPYASTSPGVMHACGHDGHTTILLTAAKILSRTPDRPNEILLVFQPAEEGGAGGNRMCEDGVLDGQVLGNPAKVIFGLHGYPNAKVGEVTTRIGPLLAAADQFKIVIEGKGAHAAYPHLGVDPIVVASYMIAALQTVASRTVAPLDSVVVTVGKVDAGVAHNVIPESAALHGTLRTLLDETKTTARAAIERLAENTAAAFGAKATIEWEDVPYPVTRNDAGATEHFRKIARGAIGEERVLEEPLPHMGGEDFSFYGRRIPACFFFLGLLPEGQERYANLHSPNFNFNDDAMPTGVELMCELALTPL